MQRGFKEGTRGQSDFWVNYHVTKRQTQKISGQEQGMHGGVAAGTYGRSVSIGYSSGQSVKTYEDGTAVFDVIDIRTGKIVWRGVAEGRLNNNMSKADREQLTITVVHELLKQFPDIIFPTRSHSSVPAAICPELCGEASMPRPALLAPCREQRFCGSSGFGIDL